MRKLKIGKKKIKQYTVKDIMGILDISKVTALKLLNSGQLKSVRIGRQHWINEDDLIVFIDGQRRVGTDNIEGLLERQKRNPIYRFILKRLLKQ